MSGSLPHTIGPEAREERGADGQHRVDFDRWACHERPRRLGQDLPHIPSMHRNWREDRSEPTHRQALAPCGLGHCPIVRRKEEAT